MNLFKAATAMFKTARATAKSDEVLCHDAYQLVNKYGKPDMTIRDGVAPLVAKFGELHISAYADAIERRLYVHHKGLCVMNVSYEENPRQGFIVYSAGISDGIDWRLALNKARQDDKKTPLKTLKTFVDSHTSLPPLKRYRVYRDPDAKP